MSDHRQSPSAIPEAHDTPTEGADGSPEARWLAGDVQHHLHPFTDPEDCAGAPRA